MQRRVFRFDSYQVDALSRILMRDQAVVPLPPKAFDALVSLLERGDRVVTKEELFSILWPDTVVEEANLFQTISVVRKTLGPMPNGQSYISTIPKRGYQFVGEVEAVESRDEPRVAKPALPRRLSWKKLLAIALGMLSLSAVVAAGAYYARRKPVSAGTAVSLRLTPESGRAATPALSPDGVWLVYSDSPDGEWRQLYRQSMKGEPPQQLTSDAADHTDPCFTPDGTRILYRSSAGEGKLGMVRFDGQDAHLLAAFSRARHPRIAPDGAHIAYWVAGNEETLEYGQTFVGRLDAESTLPVRLFPDFALAQRPLWSEDGQSLIVSGTWQSNAPEREYDAWVTGFRNGAQQGRPFKTGLFPLLLREGIYQSVSQRSQIVLNDWKNGYLYFSAPYRNSREIWRVRLNPTDFAAVGPLERLTSGSHPNSDARVDSGGAMVYSSATVSHNIYRLPLGGDAREVRLTTEPGFNIRPSLDAGGKHLVLESKAMDPGDRLLLFDLSRGVQRELGRSGELRHKSNPVLSPDGRFAAYRSMAGLQQEIWIEETAAVLAGSSTPRRVCPDCGAPMQWLSDSLILYQKDAIGTIDIETLEKRPFLEKPGNAFLTPRVHVTSPGGSGWVVFYTPLSNGLKTQLLAARVNNNRVVDTPPWKPLASGNSAIDTNPAWSPDGRRIYFISNRDGHRCIWAMDFNPADGNSSAPYPVEHFHSPERSLRFSIPYRGAAGLRAGLNDLFFALEESTGSIWRAPAGR